MEGVEKQYNREVDLLQKLQHPNIIKVILELNDYD